MRNVEIINVLVLAGLATINASVGIPEGGIAFAIMALVPVTSAICRAIREQRP